MDRGSCRVTWPRPSKALFQRMGHILACGWVGVAPPRQIPLGAFLLLGEPPSSWAGHPCRQMSALAEACAAPLRRPSPRLPENCHQRLVLPLLDLRINRTIDYMPFFFLIRHFSYNLVSVSFTHVASVSSLFFCVFLFLIAKQACTVWIYPHLFYLFSCWWTFTLFPV